MKPNLSAPLKHECIFLAFPMERIKMTEIITDVDLPFQNSLFNFSRAAGFGKALFVGEGNLSFSLSLVTSRTIAADRVTSTVFEGPRQVSAQTKTNAAKLSALGATVQYSVDAQRLKDSLGPALFDLIVFQFPNVGSRNPKYGRNPNAILARRFMHSAAAQLRRRGAIAITVVDSPHYEGAFDLIGAAKFSKLEIASIHPFKPSSFKGYTHSRTLEDSSGLSGHRVFKTWVFRKGGGS